jgi:hypothetical protein
MPVWFWLWWLALPELEDGSFPCWNELEGELRAVPTFVEELIEQLVGMGRIVMKGHKASDTGLGGEGNGLWQRTMSPAYMRQVFGRRVLGVVNQQIHACR